MGPQINVIGSFFPAWMLCALVGIVVALVARRLFVWAGIDAYVGPPVVIYASLALLITLVLWGWVFRG